MKETVEEELDKAAERAAHEAAGHTATARLLISKGVFTFDEWAAESVLVKEFLKPWTKNALGLDRAAHEAVDPEVLDEVDRRVKTLSGMGWADQAIVENVADMMKDRLKAFMTANVVPDVGTGGDPK